MRHQRPRPEMSSNNASTSTASPVASSSSTPPSAAPINPGSASHSVIRTLRQMTMNTSESRPTSFASTPTTSAILSNLDALYQAQLSETGEGPCAIVHNIIQALSNVISEMRAELDKSPQDNMTLCEDVNLLRQKFASVQRTNHMMAMHFDLLELKKKLEAEEAKKLDDRKTFFVAAREELYKEIVELLEAEFSCVICSEIFFDATVTKCGHTFCHTCIATWTKDKIDCPICRAVIFTDWGKHIELDNFITRLHLRLSDEIRQRRDALSLERSRAIEELRNAPPSRQGDSATLARALRFIQEQRAMQQDQPRAEQQQQRARVRAAVRRSIESDAAPFVVLSTGPAAANQSQADTDGPTARLRARFIQEIQDELETGNPSAAGQVPVNADQPQPHVTDQRRTISVPVTLNPPRSSQNVARIRLRPGSMSVAFLPSLTQTTSTTTNDVARDERASLERSSAEPSLEQVSESRNSTGVTENAEIYANNRHRLHQNLTHYWRQLRASGPTTPTTVLPGTQASYSGYLRRILVPQIPTTVPNPPRHRPGAAGQLLRADCLDHHYRRLRLATAAASAATFNSDVARNPSTTINSCVDNTSETVNSNNQEPRSAANAVQTIRNIFSNLDMPTSSSSSASGGSNSITSSSPSSSALFAAHMCDVFGEQLRQTLSCTLTGDRTTTTLSSSAPISSTIQGRASSPVQDLQRTLPPTPTSPIRSASSDILRAFSEETAEGHGSNSNSVITSEPDSPNIQHMNRREIPVRVSIRVRNGERRAVDLPASTPTTTPTHILPDDDDDDDDINMSECETLAPPSTVVEASLNPVCNQTYSNCRDLMCRQHCSSCQIDLMARRSRAAQRDTNNVPSTNTITSNSEEEEMDLFTVTLEGEPSDSNNRSATSTDHFSTSEPRPSTSTNILLQSFPTSSDIEVEVETTNSPSIPIVMECDSDNPSAGEQSPSSTRQAAAADGNENPDSTSVQEQEQQSASSVLRSRSRSDLNEEDIEYLYAMTAMEDRNP